MPNVLVSANAYFRLGDLLSQDFCTYSKAELKEMLDMIHEGNRMLGGLSKVSCKKGRSWTLIQVATSFGLLGFPRFLDCFYLHIVTDR